MSAANLAFDAVVAWFSQLFPTQMSYLQGFFSTSDKVLTDLLTVAGYFATPFVSLTWVAGILGAWLSFVVCCVMIRITVKIFELIPAFAVVGGAG
jgi:hypothetical protein